MAELPPHIRRAADTVARALAGYWHPVNTPVDGAVTPAYYDEVDYGQAAHVLSALLSLGWSPPGGPIEMPEELASLVVTIAELPKDGLDPHDPLLSVPLIIHLRQVRRLRTLARFLSPGQRYFGTMVRGWVLAELDRVEESACPRCTDCCSRAECASRRCREHGCPCVLAVEDTTVAVDGGVPA
jgi:hypothetical protein